MKRNNKEEWLKSRLRLMRKKDKLASSHRLYRYSAAEGKNFTWVPVEEPQFIGWETTVTLSEAALRRQDAGRLLQVLSLLNISEKRFCSNLNIIKLIRRSNKNYARIRSNWFEERRKLSKRNDWYNDDLPWEIVDIRSKRRSEKKWEEVDHSLHKYFERVETKYPATAWENERTIITYLLGGAFPIHELRVKIDQAYSTHRGIPKSDEISEATKIQEKLYQERFYEKLYYSDSSYKYERRLALRSSRKTWKSATRVALKYKKKHIEKVIDDFTSRKMKKE